MTLDISHFAQVARHPDGDQVVTLEAGKVGAKSERDLKPGFNGKSVTAEFRDSARARFGDNLKGVETLDDLERTGKPLRTRDIRNILSANQAPAARPAETRPPESRPLHVVLVGGGPRTSSQICAEIDLMLQYKDHFREIRALGGKYDIRTTYDMRTTVVEKQSRDSIGHGMAWNQDQQGTTNTGAEGWGYDQRLRELYVREKERLLVEARTPLVRSLFAKAFSEAQEAHATKAELQAAGGTVLSPELEPPAAKRPRLEETPGMEERTAAAAKPETAVERETRPRTDRAAAVRSELGKEEHGYFESRVRAAQEDDLIGQLYKLEIIPQSTVSKVDPTSPLRPRVSVQGAAGDVRQIDADVVRLNTGTPLAPPLPDWQADVAERSYIGPMSGEKLSAFLSERQLLDEKGMLKPGTKVLTGGTGLSLYDQLLVLDQVMGLSQEDYRNPLGYRVADQAKKDHQGAILITSNTPGKWISPRHSHTPQWTQDLEPVSGAREQHALFLHNQGEEVYRAWETICIATVAAATGQTPAVVRHENMTTEQLLALQRSETEKNLTAEPGKKDRTLYGAKRQAYLSTLLGMGLERDPMSAAARLGQTAPLTYKGRIGYLMHRAQLNGITRPDSVVAANNGPLIAVGNERMQDVTASPALIHAFAKELIDAGIACYTRGSYGGISVDESSGKLSFEDAQGERTEHDFFLVSPTFQLGANPAERSLEDHVLPVTGEIPYVARVGQNRMVLRPDGVPLSVESYGLGARGVRRPDGSHVGNFANDVNNRESAIQVAPGLAYRRLAEQHLATAGRIDPVGDVEAMYRDLLPDEAAYDAEVGQYREDFESAMHKAAYLNAIEEIAGDDAAEFARLYRLGANEADRILHGGAAYQAKLVEVAQSGEFNPASRDAYFDRFVDAPDHIHEQVYARAFREARETFAGMQP